GRARGSRTNPAPPLAEVAASSGTAGSGGPTTFVSASAIGFDGADRGDEVLTEDSPRGTGFLADVVADWEAATKPAAEAGLRTVLMRTGIVQSPKGGSLRRLLPLFQA